MGKLREKNKTKQKVSLCLSDCGKKDVSNISKTFHVIHITFSYLLNHLVTPIDWSLIILEETTHRDGNVSSQDKG